MKKNSTFSLYFDMYVIGDLYSWTGPKSMVLDTGRIVHGTWQASVNGFYNSGQTIRVQWTAKTGEKTESFGVKFTDNSNQIIITFRLPPYRA
jgi:hypothetical protein